MSITSLVQRSIAVLLAFLAAAAQASSFAAAAQGTATQARLDSVTAGSGAGSRPGSLAPADAFRIQVRVQDANTLVVTLAPARQYALYRDSIRFAVVQPPTVAIVKVTLPHGKLTLDPTFGRVEVFEDPTDARIVLERRGTGSPEDLRLRVNYQGCNESLGLCYPPAEQTVAVALPAQAPAPGGASPPGSATDGLATSDDRRFRELFSRGSTWTIVAAFFGFGLLLAFTPCTLPMIPILSSIIVGTGQHAGRRQLLVLSGAYVLGMAITYATAGAAAGLAGTLLSEYLRNPWVLGAFAATFVLLALSTFGLFELQLPSALQTRLSDAGQGLRGGRVAGVFGMGVLSAVIVGPCVSAALAGALLYIGQTRDVALGGLALFALAVGMGVPLLVLGATAGTLLPRAGRWMEGARRVVGVSLLALAIHMVSPLVPLPAQHLLWAGLFVVSAVYLHALDPLPADAPGTLRLAKGVGVLVLLLGVALLVGAASGSRDLLQPLAALRGAGAPERDKLNFRRVGSLAELERALEAARGQTVMLDVWAEWCVSCLEMDRFTFGDPRVQARLGKMVVLRADVTAVTPEHDALLRRFDLFGPPGIVFFDRDGRELPLRMIGYQSPEQFLNNLERLGD